MSDLVRATSGYNCVMVVETEVTVDTYTSDCLVLSCFTTFFVCTTSPVIGIITGTTKLNIINNSTYKLNSAASGITHSLAASTPPHTPLTRAHLPTSAVH
ncbi:hypothetical protein H0G86_002031 [Trichoderma simmonsii]|uniref:Uncharacterized protein n=1 Tax=Trichoderma simmonsii TaxID=1491479 RepID=A0A8G0L7P9_9HYPO|nr:hypothetical protein H0G86_002031 [Trichoderma simmonsii]